MDIVLQEILEILTVDAHVLVLCVVIAVLFLQCGAEKTVAFVGSDIRALTTPHHHHHHHHRHHQHQHQHNTHAAQESEEPLSTGAVHIYMAAPCYSFPGYAGLHLSGEHHRHRHHNTGSKGVREPVVPSVSIHTSPCYLK